MEHELLKMPDLENDLCGKEARQEESRPAESSDRLKPDWNEHFWNLYSQKKIPDTLANLIPNSEMPQGIVEKAKNAERKRNDNRPWNESSKSKHHSWRQTLRTSIYNRLKKLKEEEREDRMNNNLEETDSKLVHQVCSPTWRLLCVIKLQIPAWRVNVARAKVKILLYLRRVMMDMKDQKDHAFTIREASLPVFSLSVQQ